MEKTFEELARDVAHKQDNEAMLIGDDVKTVSKQGYARTVRGAATDEEKAEVRDLYRKGVGVCEIARRTGFAQSTVSRWVGTWQIDPKTSVKAKGNKRVKNEPAPAPTETSPQNNNLHFDDSTFKSICQAFDSVGRAVNTILDTYNAMSESEQRAFDLGESYRDMLSAKRELDEIKGGDAS